MKWSVVQDAALCAVDSWLASPGEQQVFRLFGFAGTGKTTLARHFAESCKGTVLFAAFTGKAASVMRANGCEGASTIHRLIYKPQQKSELQLFELRGDLQGCDPLDISTQSEILRKIHEIEEDLKRPSFTMNFDSVVKLAKLVIIDECSMVGDEMGHDLLSFGTPVLVLGDPMQLPPIGSAGFFTEAEPDIILTEIHRQAENSPVIQLATQVREGKSLALGDYGDSKVVDRGDFDKTSAMSHDQILVGRNRTRKEANARARELLQRGSHLPEKKDKLVCLQNNHEVGLLNGELWTTIDSRILDADSIDLTIQHEDGSELVCCAHRHHFEGRELEYWEKREAEEFDFGYALTAHKAQGSQWPSVVVFDESRCFRNYQRRWLYTAITRAEDRVTIVTNL